MPSLLVGVSVDLSKAVEAAAGNVAEPQRPDRVPAVPAGHNDQFVDDILQGQLFEKSAACTFFSVV